MPRVVTNKLFYSDGIESEIEEEPPLKIITLPLASFFVLIAIATCAGIASAHWLGGMKK